MAPSEISLKTTRSQVSQLNEVKLVKRSSFKSLLYDSHIELLNSGFAENNVKTKMYTCMMD